VPLNRQCTAVVLQATKVSLHRLQCLNHQARWIATYGRLVKHLTLSGGSGYDNADEAVICITVRPLVQLQGLTLAVTRPLQYPAAVLRQLDASHLTSLSTPVAGQDGSAALAAAVARLRSLRSLTLSAPSRSLSQLPVQGYSAALAALTSLTELSLQSVDSADLLQRLPGSVVRLQLSGAVSSSTAAVQQLVGMQQLQQLELKHVGCNAAALIA
jgi:hypothetical protein